MKYSKKVIEEIQKSIDECEKQTSVEGSEALYNRLIAKFTGIDKDFKTGLPNNGKFTSISSEFDYRPELQAVREKLRMMLIQSLGIQSDIVQRVHEKLEDLINSGRSAYDSEYTEDSERYMPDYISGPQYDMWTLELENFSKRHLVNHPLYNKITSLNCNNKGIPDSVNCILDCLIIISKDDEFFSELEKSTIKRQPEKPIVLKGALNPTTDNKVFLVHGHDNEMEQNVARALEKANIKVVILHEQPNGGMTIIEKLEKYTDVTFAIVLYSACDVGRSKKEKPQDERPRARQNVVFEHGYLNGRLGRDRVCALLKDDVEKPSDINGVLYIPMDDLGAWKGKLAQEMDKAGLDFDLKALIY